MTKRRQYLKQVGSTAIAMSLLAGCSQGGGEGTTEVDNGGDGAGGTTGSGSSGVTEGDPLVFGGTVSLTGGLAREGKYTRNGYRIWRDYVNEEYGGIRVDENTVRPIKLKLYDDKTSEETATKLYNKLVTQDDVDFLLGPYGSSLTLAVAPIAEKYQIPMVETNGSSDKIFKQGYKYTYGTLTPASKYFASTIEFMSKLDKKPVVEKAGIVHVDSLFTNTIAKGARKKLDEVGIEKAFEVTYPAGTNDLSNVVSKIKNHDIQLLCAAGHLPEDILLAKQMSSQGVKVPFIIMPGNPLAEDYQTTLKDRAVGCGSVSQWIGNMPIEGPIFGKARDYYDLYHEKFDVYPYYVPAESTAGGVAFQLAIENSGTTKPKKVKQALDNLDEMTFYGRLKFSSGKMHGANLAKPMGTVQLQGDFPFDLKEQVVVAPDEYDTGEINYPAGTW